MIQLVQAEMFTVCDADTNLILDSSINRQAILVIHTGLCLAIWEHK